jgi:transcriptional regulator with XRE-family HTH domain
MTLIETSDLIKIAMTRASLNQREMALKIGKSQAQVSKYLAGTSIPSKDTIIHIMNIISSHQADHINHIDIYLQMSQLDAVKDHDLFAALMGMIRAYKAVSR